MPFLSVVTRCYKRPAMLAKNMASLEVQSEPDYEQLFIVDDEGQGIGWANRALATVDPTSDYVMVLDDDDMLINDRAIGLLMDAVMIDYPHLVIYRAEHGELGVLPDELTWNKRPLKGHIGSCDFITRRDVWKEHIHQFGIDEGGDYAFLHAIWRDNPRTVWLDELLARTQRRSNGRPE